ncbi:hypothetical protein NliqN6_5177 [Naganishia liquefaciens]|uniref:Uncharacterized protein n=1 Tax=Naganishia liquefaciens TaxID=104408 RepID=A0A8H3TX06_9TREE|nr:hypothetical protein NliqN6_5177 [Naganishia liquefaciens]
MVSGSSIAGKKQTTSATAHADGEEELSPQAAQPERPIRLPYFQHKTYVQMVEAGRHKGREFVFGKPLAIEKQLLQEALNRAVQAVETGSDCLSRIDFEQGEETFPEEDSLVWKSTRQLGKQETLLHDTYEALQSVLWNAQGIVYDVGRIQDLHAKMLDHWEVDREAQMTDTQREAKDSVLDGTSELMDIFTQMDDTYTAGESETKTDEHFETKIPSQAHAAISAVQTREDPIANSSLFRFYRPRSQSEEAGKPSISTVGASSLVDLTFRSRSKTKN